MSMTHTSDGATAMWSMFARPPGAARRSCRTTTPQREVLGQLLCNVLFAAPAAVPCFSRWGSSPSVSSIPPMTGRLLRTRASPFGLAPPVHAAGARAGAAGVEVGQV
jgi:hypothetical protein